MEFEIVDQPIRFHLYGIEGVVENQQYGPVGLGLMNEMWQLVKSAQIPNTGINHWVYLTDKRMFVGVELRTPQQSTVPDRLQPIEFELPRYLKHVHVGPYQELPRKWRSLHAELGRRGEETGSPSLEIYGHHCDDPAQLETTILICLQKTN